MRLTNGRTGLARCLASANQMIWKRDLGMRRKGMLELIEEWPCKAIASPGTGVAAGTPAASMNKPSTSPTA